MFASVRYVRDSMPDSIDPHGRHVAMALASFADTAGHARPSTRQLEQVTGLSRHTIIDRIRQLEHAGVIAVQRLDRRTSRYRFPVQAALAPARIERTTAHTDQRGTFLPGTGWVHTRQEHTA